MRHADAIQAGLDEKNVAVVNDAVYEATNAAIEAIEKAYDDKVAKVPANEHKAYEVAYVSKAAAKVNVYEIASRAISTMSMVASDKKALIAASAIATIRQIQGS